MVVVGQKIGRSHCASACLTDFPPKPQFGGQCIVSGVRNEHTRSVWLQDTPIRESNSALEGARTRQIGMLSMSDPFVWRQHQS